MKNVIIISLSSDIACEMAKKWSNDGWNVAGTYRNKNNVMPDLGEQITLFHCDLENQNSCDLVANAILNIMPNWDILVFATGTQLPVGKFLDTNIDEWTASIHVNFINQIRLTHKLLRGLSEKTIFPSVIFFAGGGTNNAVFNYSAYTVSKIALIKMCELLDAEIPQVKFTIVGPGWVKTKIHNETLSAGEKNAGSNYSRTLEKLKSNEFTSVSDVISFIEWIIAQPKEVVGGRNFSVVYDNIEDENFIKTIKDNSDMYKLRRSMNNSFVK